MKPLSSETFADKAPFPVLRSQWQSGDALDEQAALLYRSRLLGSDLSITNYGGGNTSAKIMETDPLTGERVEVLWVKGSGGDLGSINMDGFASLYLPKLLALKSRYKGLAYEDRMVDFLPHCTFGLNGRAASIDTPLHAFLPFAHVDHVHPDAVLAIATTTQSEALTQTIYGGTVGWLGWQRPGFDLGLKLSALVAQNPDLRGIVLEGHGLFSWGETSRDCYDATLSLIRQAADYLNAQSAGKPAFGGLVQPLADDAARKAFFSGLNPRLRALTGGKIVHVVDSPEVLEFVCSADMQNLAAMGTACPDHFLRTKRLPMILSADDLSDDGLKAALEAYRTDYLAYYQRHAEADSPPVRNADPVIILVSGYGLVSLAGDKTAARLAAEYYTHAIHVMRGAQAVGTYQGLDEREAFRIEYWALEEAKLKRQPAPKPLAGKVALITGGAGGIGRAVADRLLRDGANVILTDIEATRLTEAQAALVSQHGPDRVRAYVSDAADEAAVREAYGQAAFDYGGVDIFINNAGHAAAAAIEDISLEQWQSDFNGLTQGYFLGAREAFRAMKALGGAMVFIVSKNALSPSAGSAAYNAAKAAQLHLARCLAVEGAPHGIRVNVVNPDAVLRDSHIWDGQWRAERAGAYGLEPSALEAFYQQRSLLKREVFPQDVAEAVAFFVSEVSAKSTGNILNVDAGHAASFTR
ncbi:MAG: bifunctional rhamnulose-1-phosphate aldolase/short-chain dehydrogenase [Asticcacaulis sp.]